MQVKDENLLLLLLHEVNKNRQAERRKHKSGAERGGGVAKRSCPWPGWLHFVSSPLCPVHPLTHFSCMHQSTWRSSRDRLKMHKQQSLPQSHAHFRERHQDQPSLDTSNQWNPQGLGWVFNEEHCPGPEPPSPRNGLTFWLVLFLLLLASFQQPMQQQSSYLVLHLSFTATVTHSLSVHHGDGINTCSLVQAHPHITSFSLLFYLFSLFVTLRVSLSSHSLCPFLFIGRGLRSKGQGRRLEDWFGVGVGGGQWRWGH